MVLFSSFTLDYTDNLPLEDPTSNFQLTIRSIEPVENFPSAAAAVSSSEISSAEEKRRRLYLNFGRPRPFYRTVSEHGSNEGQETRTNRSRQNS